MRFALPFVPRLQGNFLQSTSSSGTDSALEMQHEYTGDIKKTT